MTTPSLNYFTYAVITLKHKTTGASKFVYVSTREIIDNTIDTYYIPILMEVSKLGQVHDRTGPANVTGSLKILDDLHAYGVDRKFSDLLQQYTIIYQDISIATGTGSLSANKPDSATTRFKGKILDYEVGKEGQQNVINLRIESRIFERRLVNKLVDSTSFNGLPNTSNNRALPIIFGSAEVVPTVVSQGVAPDYQYDLAYATTLGTQYPVGGVANYYCRDIDGVYREVHSAATVNTAVYGNDLSALVYRPTSPTGLDPNWHFALNIGWASNKKHILTGGFMYFKHDASATQAGYIQFDLHERKAGGSGPGIILASAQVAKEDITWSTSSAAPQIVSFSFEKPVQLSRATRYYLSVSQSSTDGYSNIYPATFTSSGTEAEWVYENGGWKKFRDTINGDYFKKWYGLYAVTMTDTAAPGVLTVNEDGLNHASVTVTQHAALSGIDSPDLTELNFVFYVNGLKDDSLGTITGVANQALTGPKHQMQLLDMYYYGSTWIPNNFDFSKYSSTHDMVTGVSTNYLARTASGQTEDRTYQEDLMRELCENMAMRIVLANDGKLALWAWGKKETTQAILTQDDCKLIRWWQVDGSFIANKVKIEYNKKYSYYNPLTAHFGNTYGVFSALLNYKDPSDATLATLIYGISETLYGKRPLAQQQRIFVANDAAAKVLSTYYGSVFKEPPKYAEIEVPLHRYSTLEPMNVIELTLPGLPSYYGSSANARQPDYSGTAVDAALGYVYTRAETYRAQIESRVIDILGDEGPKITFTCRLLNNHPADPT